MSEQEEFNYSTEQKSLIDKLLIPLVQAEPCMYNPAARKLNRTFKQEKFFEDISPMMSLHLKGISKFLIIFQVKSNLTFSNFSCQW